MDKESLRRARIEVMKALECADIKYEDKLELAVNLFHFLDERKYKKNIKTLKLDNNNNNS